MPRCAVPECHAAQNRLKKNPIAMCKFPVNPEIIKFWLINLNRPNWQPTRSSLICASHFRTEDFIVVASPSKRKNKKERRFLKDNAVPTIFPDLPNARNTMISTEEVEKKLQEIEAEKLELARVSAARAELELHIAAMKRESHDFITDFASFKAHVKDKLILGKYNLFKNEDKCVFYQVEDSQDTECAISLRISVSNTLKLRVLIGDTEDSRHFERLRIINRRLLKWSQMSNLLDAYRDGTTQAENENINCECLLKRALLCLNLAKPLSKTFASTDKLDIIINQLENILKPRCRRYNAGTVKMAFMLFTHSHATLDMLRTFLHLPGNGLLQRVSSKMLISTNFDITTRKDRNLSDPENFVALIIDELYIDRDIQYNNDKLVATAILNPSKDPKTLLLDTKTILTFTIKSLFGNLQEIVRMSPAIYPFGDIIYSHTKEALDYVQNMGFNIKLMIADTSKNGQRIFQRFSDKNHYFTNPRFPDHQTYLYHDILQILNDIRNDWFDLINADRTFIYPDIDTLEIKEASFMDFEILFELDNSNAMKKAPKLTKATIHPNDIDKNNVTLASNIFHESTISALREDDSMHETADFCATIKKWWDIVITNDPILLYSDERYKYLESFAAWIRTWRNARSNPGRLKYSTFHAIESTTKTLIELIKFSFSHCQAEFLNLGKLQKDSIENRFKFYEAKMKSKANQLTEGNLAEIDIDDEFESLFKDDLDDPLDWETEFLNEEQDDEEKAFKMCVTVNLAES